MQTFIGIILGGGFLAFLQFLITRYDSKHDRFLGIQNSIEELRKDIDRIDAKGDRREAVNSRVRILRFEDELIEGRRHSKDSFDQVMSDIDSYDRYCEAHPEFKNNQTATTASHIKTVYHDRLEKRDFS